MEVMLHGFVCLDYFQYIRARLYSSLVYRLFHCGAGCRLRHHCQPVRYQYKEYRAGLTHKHLTRELGTVFSFSLMRRKVQGMQG